MLSFSLTSAPTPAPAANRFGGWAVRCRRGFVVLVAGLLTGLLVGTAPAGPLLTEIALTERADGGGYVLRVASTERIDTYGMPQRVGENELKWVLYETGLHDQYRSVSAEGPIKRYEVERRGGNVVLHLYLDSSREISASAYRDGASNDLLLNLAYADGVVASRRSAQGSTSSGASSSGSASTASGPPTRTASAQGASKEARERWTLDTVVIDAGHGGKDPGAQANGYSEKDLVLDVALKLGDYIKEKLGINVVYTRTSDKFIELEERGHIANRAGAKLFISLHINAARARSAKGTETFFLGPSKTEAARKVMERENSVIKYEDNTQVYEDYDKEALVRQTLTQSMYMQKSERLASLIESQFANRVQRRSRGVHQAGFYVLWSASMPSVLVELGFLTNRREARFLSSDRGQTYLASAIFRAVRDYKQDYEKGINARQAATRE